MSLLSESAARRIAEDLNNDANVKKHVEKLLKKTVTPDILREVKLEEALARHTWHPQLCIPVQGLLTKYVRILRVDDEAKKASEQKTKDKKCILMMKKENEIEETGPRFVVQMATSAVHQPQMGNRKAPALRVITNTARNDAIKRKNNADSEEPVTKQKRLEVIENFHRKLNITPMKSTKTVKTVEEPKKGAGNEEDLFKTVLSKFERMFIKQKNVPKDVKNSVAKKMESKEEHRECIKKVVRRIENLSGKLELSEIEDFLNGVTAYNLKEAEQSFGRNLKRLDRIWWFLLVRDFCILPDGFSSDPRIQYFEEVRKQNQKKGNRSRDPIVSFKENVVIL